MPVFSSTLISTVPGGGFRYRRHTTPALTQKAGSSAQLSQPRTLCGRTLASASYLTAWADDGDDNDEQIPLCRIEYLGNDEDWGFAIYDPAAETYTPAL